MAMNVKLEIPGLDKAISEASAPLIKAQQNRKLLDVVGRAFVQRVRAGFRESRSPDGVPWAPLKFRDGRPLVDTGSFSYGITHRIKSATEVEIGGPEKWASVHQYGATIKPKKGQFLIFRPPGFKHPIYARQVVIPARPFMPIGYLPDA